MRAAVFARNDISEALCGIFLISGNSELLLSVIGASKMQMKLAIRPMMMKNFFMQSKERGIFKEMNNSSSENAN